MKSLLFILTAAFAFSGILFAQQIKSQRFIIINTHTAEECLGILDKVSEKGEKLLARFDWSCIYGEHNGYAIIETKDEAALKALLPAELKKIRIIKVSKFTIEQIKSFHLKE